MRLSKDRLNDAREGKGSLDSEGRVDIFVGLAQHHHWISPVYFSAPNSRVQFLNCPIMVSIFSSPESTPFIVVCEGNPTSFFKDL